MLDHLAREFRVLIVVSAGNHRLAAAGRASDAERVVGTYPQFLFQVEAGLCDPATSALSLTVGALAGSDVPACRHGSQANDIVLPVARRNEPNPCTRIGPGVNGAIKPELVEDGGNVAFAGFGSSNRRILDGGDRIPDPGLAVMSFSHQPLETLFSYGVGTSYAAPKVARLAARLWHHLRNDLDLEPHPNLIRAVLASSAEPPEAVRKLLEVHGRGASVGQVCGYGLPNEDHALHSTDSRVTLVAQATQKIDTITLWEIPVPTEFVAAQGRKRIIVSLAFDPPARRRRQKYLGVEMQVDLLRGKTPDEIEAAYGAISREDRKTSQKSFQDRHRCKLEPGPNACESGTLHRRVWAFQRGDTRDGDTYYLLVRSFRNWAPEEMTHRDYAVAVTLEAQSDELYRVIRQRLQQQARQRVRP